MAVGRAAVAGSRTRAIVSRRPALALACGREICRRIQEALQFGELGRRRGGIQQAQQAKLKADFVTLESLGLSRIPLHILAYRPDFTPPLTFSEDWF